MALRPKRSQRRSQRNPYANVEKWFHASRGKKPMGSTSGFGRPQKTVTSGWPNDARELLPTANLAPILDFEASGKLLQSSARACSFFPTVSKRHKEGNSWVTDGQGAEVRGHQVFKFSPQGKVLMTARRGRAWHGDGTEPSINRSCRHRSDGDIL